MDEEFKKSPVKDGLSLKGSVETRSIGDDNGERQIDNRKTNRHNNNDRRSKKSSESTPING